MLTQSLLDRCAGVLERCVQLESQDNLRDVFVTTELAAYRAHVPDTSALSRAERSVRITTYLWDKKLVDGRPLLLLFLREVRERQPPADSICQDLDDLCDAVNGIPLAEHLEIPFVVMAMTGDEARDLVDETVYDHEGVAVTLEERGLFRDVRRTLNEVGIQDLLTYYGDSRESWTPPMYAGRKVQEVVLDTVNRLNVVSRTSRLPLIVPQFASTSFFAESNATNLWDRLGESGCIIIVDSISLFHPVLRRRLGQSELGSNPRVAILVLSPVSPAAIMANQLIEQLTNREMQRAYARFAEKLERSCEFGVGDERAMRRWLWAVVPETAQYVQGQRPSEAAKQAVRDYGAPPMGVNQLFLGSAKRR